MTTLQNEKVQDFLESTKNYCVGIPKFTSRGISITLKREVVADRKKYDEIRILAMGVGATPVFAPNVGFFISLTESESDSGLLHLHVADIEGGGPQPRTKVEPDDPETVKLYANIKAKGQLDPVKVYPSPTTPGKYRIYEGHRRHMVIFNMLQQPEILAISKNRTELEAHEDAFLLNNIRQNLSPYDQGHYIAEVLMKRFPEEYSTQEAMGKKLGLSQETISLILKAYREVDAQKDNLSPEIIAHAINLPARTLHNISQVSEAVKPSVIEQVVEKELSVLDTEKLVKEVNAVPGADEKTVEEKAKALREWADKEKHKTDRTIEKLIEDAVARAPEGLVREAVGRAGDNKVTQDKLNDKLATIFSILYERARSKKTVIVSEIEHQYEDGEMDEIFTEAEKW